MSQTFSRFLHPFDVAPHPNFEPEVERIILAFWTSEQSASKDGPALCRLREAKRAIPIDDSRATVHALKHSKGQSKTVC